jgi:hypothetical protein
MFHVAHVCTHPKLTLPSWEGRRFFCTCGAVYEYRGGEFVLVRTDEIPEQWAERAPGGRYGKVAS